MSDKVHDMLVSENWQLENFQRLGLSREDAIIEFASGVDYHDVENFLEKHPRCEPRLACQIVR